jgi:hypothetical protein
MRTVLTLITFAVLSALVVGLLLLHRRDVQREAIQSVLTQRAEARSRAIVWIVQGLNRRQDIDTRVYIPALQKINPLECPERFRQAWLDYEQAWERRADAVLQQQIQLRQLATKVNGSLGLGVTGGHVAYGSEHPNLEHAAEDLAKEDSNEDWLTCKRVAMEYGVFVPAD